MTVISLYGAGNFACGTAPPGCWKFCGTAPPGALKHWISDLIIIMIVSCNNQPLVVQWLELPQFRSPMIWGEGGVCDFTPRPPRTTITRSAESRSSWSGCSPLAFLAWLHLVERIPSQCSPPDNCSIQARPLRQGGSFRLGISDLTVALLKSRTQPARNTT
ncbi:hypothetical protein T265_06642 [Opisthorchis viverrini]|uniref:Uncharacterized protein n=1 Tax=Opisthorchis viverrini TaxID=6198 RepID=A0A074ZFE7_OPIVI|nr:hypothetical protein T265_06642 [Opisthorchis viverrini]KER26006.1 hypothetical protein T265_06642 [Opisthorchis viverrini]